MVIHRLLNMNGLVHLIICLLIPLVFNICVSSDALQDEETAQKLTYIPTSDDHWNTSVFEKFASGNMKDTSDASKNRNLQFAGGMVSVDCLRCLCLMQSNCKAVGCEMRFSVVNCGYFQITRDIWTDCGKPGSDWKKCADDVLCSSQCIQNYMKRYAERYSCVLKCEGYTRELLGGPNGCNYPTTIPYWNALQKVPGCKGVE